MEQDEIECVAPTAQPGRKCKRVEQRRPSSTEPCHAREIGRSDDRHRMIQALESLCERLIADVDSGLLVPGRLEGYRKPKRQPGVGHSSSRQYARRRRAARSISSSEGRKASSRGGEYGTGVSSAPMMRIG